MTTSLTAASQSIALCTVVTEAVLGEFALLRSSFELFHGTRHRWFVRSDTASSAALARLPSVTCVEFCESMPRHVPNFEPSFQRIAAQKMNVLADAWRAPGVNGALLLDADLAVTAEFMTAVLERKEDLVLTPNYYPWEHQHLAPLHGYFNSGFVFTRTPAFHDVWHSAFAARPWLFTDQACLNDVAGGFSVHLFGPAANVGFWRSSGWSNFEYAPIPDDCLFLHSHFFQPLSAPRAWVDRMFSLHALRFLLNSPKPEHHRICELILNGDASGWYRATLNLIGPGSP